VAKHIDATTGAFVPEEGYPKKAKAMLDELHKWATVLKPMRA
jgi:hypothetical protein